MAYRFYFTRNPKLKFNSGIVMPRQKQNDQEKKFFSRNTPPGIPFYLGKYTKSIVCFILTIPTKSIVYPRKSSARKRVCGPVVLSKKEPSHFCPRLVDTSSGHLRPECVSHSWTLHYLVKLNVLVISGATHDTHDTVVKKKK